MEPVGALPRHLRWPPGVFFQEEGIRGRFGGCRPICPSAATGGDPAACCLWWGGDRPRMAATMECGRGAGGVTPPAVAIFCLPDARVTTRWRSLWFGWSTGADCANFWLTGGEASVRRGLPIRDRRQRFSGLRSRKAPQTPFHGRGRICRCRQRAVPPRRRPHSC